jgi:hypothetical protein
MLPLPDWSRLLLAAVACYRLAQLVALDDGPGDWLLRFRAWAGAYEYGEDGRARTSAGRLVGCPYCVGVWIAAALVLLLVWPSVAGDLFLLWWGIAGVQAAMEDSRNDGSESR